MPKKLIPLLSDTAVKELEFTYRNSSSHVLRQRCHIVLLKSQGYSSKHISELQGFPSNQVTINHWIYCYQDLGIDGLKNKAGQGRKSILNKEIHEVKVTEIVKSERQRLDYAKSLIEKELDVKMSKKTLIRFLKTVAVSLNE
jgi:transposase